MTLIEAAHDMGATGAEPPKMGVLLQSPYPQHSKNPAPCAMRHSFDGYGYKYIDSGSGSNWLEFAKRNFPDAEPVYEQPAAQRQPLTDEEIRKVRHHVVDGAYHYSFQQGVRYAEAAHNITGEKK